jgi:hypothetical protein
MPVGHHSRRTVQYRAEVVTVARFGSAGRQSHPHRQLQGMLCGHGGIDCGLGRVERRTDAVAGVLETGSRLARLLPSEKPRRRPPAANIDGVAIDNL